MDKLDSFHYEMNWWMKLCLKSPKKSSNVGRATEKVGRTLNWWYVNQIFSKFIHKFEAIEIIRIEKNGGR